MATKFLKAQNGGIYKDANGKLILVDLSLPALSNPATAEDIASGKEAYGADGVAITGTAESGGTVITGEVTAKSTTEISFADIPMQPKCVIIENREYGSKKIYAAFSSVYAESTALRIVYGTTYTMWTGGTIPTTYDSNTKTFSIGVGISGSTFITSNPYKYKIVY